MKKHLQVLIFLMLPIFSISQTSFEIFEIDDIKYWVTSSQENPTVKIIDSPNATGAIVIPETVTHQGITYHVTDIGTWAFTGNILTSVTIPGSVTAIGRFAFSGNLLEKVKAKGITPVTIYSETFGNHREKIALIIPEGTKSEYGTAGWTGFKSITEDDDALGIITFEKDHINYRVTSLEGVSPTVEIKASPNATGAIVIIPETVTHQGITYRVTAIGNYAFRDNGLTSVIIPDSVSTIGRFAFDNNGLTSVIIPDSVTAIGNFAFRYNDLTSVTIPDSVISIGEATFYNNALEKVKTKGLTPATIFSNTFKNRAEIALIIPEGTKSVYKSAGWTGFKSITEDDDELGIITFEIDHINYRVTSLEGLSPTVEIKESPTATGAIDIPETVTHEDIIYRVTVIGDEAFAGNGLTSVTIPDNVTSIGSRAFYDNVLTSVTIGNSVTAIGAYAFRNNAITSVVIPDSVTDIGFDAFAHNALTSVTIANSGVTAIGRGAFSYNNLTSVTIPDSVTAISYGAFDKNPLTEVIVQSAIPASIEDTSFGNRAIVYLNVPESLKQDYINSGWTGFQDQPVETFTQDNVNYVKTGEASAIVIQSPKATGAIEIPEAIIYQGITYNVTAIEDYAFAYNALTSVTIGNSVTTIGYRAFLHNGLTSVTIGNSVTAIGDEAFRGNALEKVMAKGMTPATILSDTFGNREEIALMIPEGTKEAYEAAGWTGFKSITEDDETLSITDKDLNTSVHLILNDSYLKIQSTQANLKAYAIYNIQGINVLKGTADKVAVDRLSSGMYIAVLSFDKGTMSKKFIIE